MHLFHFKSYSEFLTFYKNQHVKACSYVFLFNEIQNGPLIKVRCSFDLSVFLSFLC